MRFAVPRAIAFILPVLLLPAAVQAAPKQVGTVSSGNGVVISHDGKVTPASNNSPVFDGDKVMTLPGGSANVQLPDKSVHLGSSSMTDSHGSVVSMDSKPSGKGDGMKDAGDKLADANFKHHHDDGDDDDDDCPPHFPHPGHGWHGGDAWGHEHGAGHHDDDHDHGDGHDHDHGHCPVSP